jgi:hypothetical protein
MESWIRGRPCQSFAVPSSFKVGPISPLVLYLPTDYRVSGVGKYRCTDLTHVKS